MRTKRVLNPKLIDEIPQVSCEEVFAQREKVEIIDVRRPDEFNNELGHIAGAKLVTLGPELTRFLESVDREKEIVFVCRSGMRSGQATLESLKMGFKAPVNMAGGMIGWNEAKLPKERNL